MPKRLFTSAEIQSMLDEYPIHRSINQLKDRFRCSHRLMERTLRSNGIDTKNDKPAQRGKVLYRIRDDYFAKIDSHEKAYILGFLYADGCNHRKQKWKSCVSIRLKSCDRYILEYFRDCIYLDVDRPLYVSKQQDGTGLNLSSKQISDDLLAIGMGPGKTIESHLPALNDELMASFMLGYFDGDGCIYLQRVKLRSDPSKGVASINPSVDIISNHYIINEMVEWFSRRGVLFKTKEMSGNPHYLHMYISSTERITKFYEIVYAHQKTFLKRKHDRFMEFFQYKQTKTYGSILGRS